VEAFRLIDGAGNDLRVIQLAIQALEELIASHPPVLVHCHAGRSRSVVIVAAYLARTMDLEPQRALACVKNKRAANVTPELLELLDQL
jgi:protein-tyrosine phosphatase